MTSILVTGGTGNLGSHVVPRLIDSGQPLRLLSRKQHPPVDAIEYAVGDTVRGTGLEEAVSGIETVVHLAGGAKGDDVAARNLVAAAREAGVRHLVTISVIGADRMPIGYFRAQAEAEAVIMSSGIPWTTLRAAQFHDFVMRTMGAMAKMPLVPVPSGLRFEPVDVSEVAARMATLALASPQGRVPDLAGPEVLDVRQILDALVAAGWGRRPRLRVRIPGKVGRAYRAGDNLADGDAERGGRRWAEFVAHSAGT
jgi:uncharacterized protein YbjT (DUF2867 family)